MWQNLGTAVEQVVSQHTGCMRPPSSDTGDLPDLQPPQAQKRSPFEARIRERHALVHGLLVQGHGIREITRELHMDGNTARRCARTAIPEQLLGGRRQPRPSQLDPYKSLPRMVTLPGLVTVHLNHQGRDPCPTPHMGCRRETGSQRVEAACR